MSQNDTLRTYFCYKWRLTFTMDGNRTARVFADKKEPFDYCVTRSAPVSEEQVVVFYTVARELLRFVYALVESYNRGDTTALKVRDVGARGMYRVTFGRNHSPRNE